MWDTATVAYDPREGGDWDYVRTNLLHRGMGHSPCKSRPDTNRPCPLIHRQKHGSHCPCALLPGGKGHHTESELWTALANGEVEDYPMESRLPDEGSPTQHPRAGVGSISCATPECLHKVEKNGFCHPCAQRRRYREAMWRKKFGTSAPEWFLSQPGRQGKDLTWSRDKDRKP